MPDQLEKTRRVPKVLRPAADDARPVGPHTEAVLSAVLGFNLDKIEHLTGLVPPEVKLTKTQRRNLELFFTSAMSLAMLQDEKRRKTC